MSAAPPERTWPGSGRGGFRDALNAAIRTLRDPVGIQAEAARLLCRHLGAGRALYAEVQADGEHAVVHRDFADGVPSFAGRYRMDDFGPAVVGEARAGRTISSPDVGADARLDASELATYSAARVRAYIAVPLVKQGRLAAFLIVHATAPRDWAPAEIGDVEHAAESTWAAVERARAEEAVREGEARYRTLFEAIDEGLCTCEMILDAAGAPVDYRFLDVNARFEEMAGLPDAVGRTARELVPDLERWWVDTYARVGIGRETLRFEHGSEAMGRFFDVFATPLEPAGRFAVVFTDTTSRRRAEEALRESEARFRQAVELAPQLVWIGDGAGTLQFVNERWSEYSGLDLAATRDPDRLERAIHADDREEMLRRRRDSLASGDPFEMEARLRDRHGGFRWFLLRAVPLRDDAGPITRWFGVATDIQERRLAEGARRAELARERRAHELATLSATIGQALDEEVGVDLRLERLADLLVPEVGDLCIIDLSIGDGRLRRATVRHADPALQAALEAIPLPPSQRSPTHRVWRTGEAMLMSEVADSILREAATDESDLERRRALAITSAVSVPMWSRRRGVGVITLGATGRSGRVFEQGDLRFLAQIGERAGLAVDNAILFERESIAHDRAERAHRRVRELHELASALSAAVSRADVAEVGALAIMGAVGGQKAWVVECDDGGGGFRTVFTSGFAAEITRSLATIPPGAPFPVVEAGASGRPMFFEDAAGLLARYPRLAEVHPEVGSAAFVPIADAGASNVGLGILFSQARPFGESDRSQMLAMGGLIGQALARAERHDTQRQVASALQRSLLPARMPAVEGLAIAAHYSPGAAHTQAGGDWYDAFLLGGGQLALTVGDVVGSGPEAAAVMGQLRSVLKAALLRSRSPGAALADLNAFAAHLDGAVGCTAVCAVLDPREGGLRWARAGHPPPIVVDAPGARLLEEIGGQLLGVRGDARYPEAHLELGPGQSLVAFSDGLFERRGLSIDDGLRGLTEQLESQAPIARALIDRAAQLAQGSADDVVAVAVTRLAPALRLRHPAHPAELAAVRAEARAWLSPLGLDRLRFDDIVLALSEATANAAEHAYPPDAPGAIDVELTQAEDGRIRVVVSDRGRWRPPTPSGGSRGRGLRIVDAVADDMRIDRRADGTAVAMEFRAEARGDRPAGTFPPQHRGEPFSAALGADGVLRVVGDVDGAGADALAEALRESLRTGGTAPIVDLGGVTFFGSDAVDALIRASGVATATGRAVRVVASPGGSVARVLSISGADRELDVVDSVAAARS